MKPAASYFEAILNATTESVFLLNLDGVVLAVNAIAASRLGRSRAEVQGQNLFDLLPPELAELRRLDFTQAAHSGVPVDVEDQRGEWHFAVNYYPIKEADGTVEMVAIYATDITARKLAQQAMRDSENRYRRFAEELPLGIVITQQGLIKYVNQSAAQMIGYPMQELLEMPFLPLVCAADQARVMDLHLQRMRGEEVVLNYPIGVIHKCGEVRQWSMHVSTVEWDGKLSALGSFMDMTERYAQDRELELTQRRLTMAQRAASAGIWEWTLVNDTMYWSPEMCALFGLDGASTVVALDTWRRAVHPDDLDAARARTRDAIQSATPLASEYRIVLPNGQTRWIAAYGSTTHDADGKPIMMSGISVDISERRRLQTALGESNQRYRMAFMASPDAVNITRVADGRYLEVSDGFVQMTGWRREEVLGKSSMEIGLWANPQDRTRFVKLLKSEGFFVDQEANFLAKDGHTIESLMSGRLLTIDGENCLLSVTRDITERNKAQAELQLAANVFGHAREGITITNAQGTIIDVNAAFTRITGYSREEAMGQNPRMLNSGRQDRAFYVAMWRALAVQGHWSGEVWNRRKNGEVFAGLLTISAICNAAGAVQHYVALFSDITAIKEHQDQLEHIAHFDALTGLPNRVLVADRLQQAMAHALRRGQHLAVAYLDLDGFKAINDSHGHDVGDRVLVALASRMKYAMREGDTLARLGGDEFVAVLIELQDMGASVPLLTRLLAAAAQPVQVGDLTLQVSASVGVTYYPQAQDIDPDQLLRQADQAMYQAKVAGKNRYHVFDAAHDSLLRGQHESLQRIRLALENNEFVLHYQPKVNMRSGQVVGAEALIRWQHPERGLLAPAAFLPVIEDHPLAVAVGEWVIDTALGQIETWQAAGLDVHVSVNIGARQLQQGDFVDRLRAILARRPNMVGGCLELEVLETSALADIAQVSQVIEECAQFGVHFALDDFGTGYSSLTYLKRLRVTLLKIDQSFVCDMLDDPDDLAILQGVIGLATAFKRQVIAEGVETIAHGTLLLQLGCELAQGYGIARPMPADQFPAWAAVWQPDAAWS